MTALRGHVLGLLRLGKYADLAHLAQVFRAAKEEHNIRIACR